MKVRKKSWQEENKSLKKSVKAHLNVWKFLSGTVKPRIYPKKQLEYIGMNVRHL